MWLLFMTLGLLVAIPAIALADNLQGDDLTTGGNATKAPNSTGTAKFYLVANGSDDPQCNVDATRPATVTVSSNQSWLTIDSPGTLQLSGCGAGNAATIGYSVSSTAPDGGVATVSGVATGGIPGNNGYNNNPGKFTVTVEVPTASDTTAPTINLTTPTNGATYTLNEVVNASYTCADETGGSGLASCVGTVANGSPIDTSSVGAKSFTVDAADNEGNTRSVTHNYNVVYDFSGFFQPVDNNIFNSAKAGQSIPVKFGLGGDQGLGVFAAGWPKVTQVACPSASDPVDPIENYATSSANNQLNYDSTTEQYNYVWKTEKAWGGKCLRLDVKFNDNVTKSANFKFTK